MSCLVVHTIEIKAMKDNLPNRLLRLMSDGVWHSREELVDAVGHRFSATIHTLKKQDCRFEKRHVEGQRYEYRLILAEHQESA